MRNDWEGIVKFDGKKYYVQADYYWYDSGYENDEEMVVIENFVAYASDELEIVIEPSLRYDFMDRVAETIEDEARDRE